MTGRQVEAPVGPTLARFQETRERQREVASQFELLSPALLARRLLADAVGTDEARHLAFRTAALRAHRELKDQLTGTGVAGRAALRRLTPARTLGRQG